MNGSIQRLVCFTAYSQNLRALAFIRAFEKAGYVTQLSYLGSMTGTIYELILTLIPNCWMALRCKADLAIGFKQQPNVVLPLLICKLRGIPTWIDVDDLEHGFRKGILSFVLKTFNQLLSRGFHVVSYHNRELRTYLTQEMGYPEKKLVQIIQGVDTQLFKKTCDDEFDAAFRAQFENRLMALYTAHLNVASDLDIILQSWRLVVADYPQALLLILGGGPLQKSFEEMAKKLGIEDHVFFTGKIDHSEVRKYAGFAKVALLYSAPRPGNIYRCSLKLREYFAMGIPVVCNDFGELVDFEQFTYQSLSSPEDFVMKISSVLQGNTDGREERARDFAEAQLDWNLIINSGMQNVISVLHAGKAH